MPRKSCKKLLAAAEEAPTPPTSSPESKPTAGDPTLRWHCSRRRSKRRESSSLASKPGSGSIDWRWRRNRHQVVDDTSLSPSLTIGCEDLIEFRVCK